MSKRGKMRILVVAVILLGMSGCTFEKRIRWLLGERPELHIDKQRDKDIKSRQIHEEFAENGKTDNVEI